MFLNDLLLTPSPSGGERKIANLFAERLKDICSVEIDALDNAICFYNGGDGPVILLEAHSDEVSLQVSIITEDGFVYFRRCGAIDNQTLQGSEVLIHSRNGDIEGVVGKKPIHLIGDNIDKVPSPEEMWIDIFVDNREEAEKKVAVGDYITIKPNFQKIGDRLMSKSIDDKIGLYIISEATRLLAEQHSSSQIYCCACSQEEVGSRGCRVAANQIRPEFALCVDVGFATDFPGMKDPKYGKIDLGKGVVINHSCDNNPEFVNLITDIAAKKGIPYQPYTSLSPTGGTDTSAIQLAGNGVITALLSIPCRYMHTPVEICDSKDVKAAIELITSVVFALETSIMNRLKTITFGQLIDWLKKKQNKIDVPTMGKQSHIIVYLQNNKTIRIEGSTQTSITVNKDDWEKAMDYIRSIRNPADTMKSKYYARPNIVVPGINSNFGPSFPAICKEYWKCHARQWMLNSTDL